MKDIKFRAWDAQLGKMFYMDKTNNRILSLDFGFSPFSLKGADIELKVFEEYEINNHNTRGKSYSRYLSELGLMQFTGLVDKNGKEIYEMDIVCYMNSSAETWYFPVEYKPACFMAGQYYLNDKTAKDYCVVGNIHETPELLKK